MMNNNSFNQDGDSVIRMDPVACSNGDPGTSLGLKKKIRDKIRMKR